MFSGALVKRSAPALYAIMFIIAPLFLRRFYLALPGFPIIEAREATVFIPMFMAGVL